MKHEKSFARVLRVAAMFSLVFVACVASVQAQSVTVQYTMVSNYGSGLQR
jgi:hypothetical protein